VAKKPNISKEAQVLLKLLRIALGTEPRKYFGEVVEPFPEGIDWKEVVRLSYEHKVSALAVDGLEASKYDPYKGLCFDGLSNLNEKQTEELKAVLVPWIKDVENTEWSYCYYVEVLKTLCQIFMDNGLTPIILKGYGLSLNYPRPSHRGAGDIDIFLIDKDGKPAAEEGDRIAREVLGVEVIKKKGVHHSQFSFKGITVENHYEIVGANCGRKREFEFKKYIKEEIIKRTQYVEGIRTTTPIFDAIFLVQHKFSHSFCGMLKLRQFFDLAAMVCKHNSEIDWKYVVSILQRFGLFEYAQGVYGILRLYFGVPNNIFLEQLVNNDDMTYCVMNDMMIYGKSKYRGVRNFSYHFRNRWHHYFFNRRHWLWQMIKYANIYVFQRLINLFTDGNESKK